MQASPAVAVTVSFVIRTYNEAAFIGRLLDTIRAQQGVLRAPEIIVVDSGSTDDTVKIAGSMGARLLHIRKEDFDYSKALNLGIENASGDCIAILSAHSIPCDSDWLRSMLSHFEDRDVAGVFSRQVPWPDAHWWETRRIRNEFGEQRAVYERANALDAVPFSNSASCIKRAVWEKHRFALPTGEDGEWATWAVSQGYKIIYDADAAVYHSHNETCRQAMRRAVQFERAADLKLRRSRTPFLTLKQAGGLVFRDLRDVLHCSTWPRLRLAWESLIRGYWFVRYFRGEAKFRSPVRHD